MKITPKMGLEDLSALIDGQDDLHRAFMLRTILNAEGLAGKDTGEISKAQWQAFVTRAEKMANRGKRHERKTVDARAGHQGFRSP